MTDCNKKADNAAHTASLIFGSIGGIAGGVAGFKVGAIASAVASPIMATAGAITGAAGGGLFTRKGAPEAALGEIGLGATLGAVAGAMAPIAVTTTAGAATGALITGFAAHQLTHPIVKLSCEALTSDAGAALKTPLAPAMAFNRQSPAISTHI